MTYPTKQQLDAMGVTLEKDIHLCSAELRAWFHGAQTQAVRTMREDAPAPEQPPRRKHVKTAAGPRTFASPYVGVTRHRNRWIAQYGARGRVKTKVHPLTPEGEKAAAADRACALGLDYLEMRDGTRA